MTLRVLIVVLSVAGLADALYFTFAYYGRLKKARWVPEILCAREGSSCVTVVQTPYARIFGLPNSLFGVVYYFLLLGGAGNNWAYGLDLRLHFAHFAIPFGLVALILASGMTVLVGLYLIYALRRKLHVDCPLCYTAHAINTALFVLLVVLAA